MTEEEELEKSDINTGVAIAYRLNESWAKCSLAYQQANWARLNSILDTIYLEMTDDIKPKDTEKYNRLNYFISHDNLSPFWITQKWVFTKKLQKKQGLGKKYYDESATSIA